MLEKVSRKPRNDSYTHRENRRILGPSIEKRPKDIETRAHFGHWEIATLLGARAKDDPVLLTLVEWKTRFENVLKIDQQDQASVDHALDQLYEQLGDQATSIFQTITSDNGSEFAGIYELLKDTTDVFFAHP